MYVMKYDNVATQRQGYPDLVAARELPPLLRCGWSKFYSLHTIIAMLTNEVNNCLALNLVIAAASIGGFKPAARPIPITVLERLAIDAVEQRLLPES